ncbi:MAG: hypothetical protein QXQ81_04630 [Candidatus Thorarchaeota archaeon]
MTLEQTELSLVTIAGRLLVLFVILAMVLGIGMIIVLQPQIASITGGLPILDTRFYYTSDEVMTLMTILGEYGRSLYMTHLALDMFFPAAYGASLVIATFMMARPTIGESLARRVAVLPVAGTLFDYAENALILVMLVQYPSVSPLVATLSSAMTTSKWCFLTFSIVILLLLGVLRLRSGSNRPTS